MSTELGNECERLGSWGVVGKGLGATVLSHNGQPMSRNELVTSDNNLRASHLLQIDSTTGLIVAKSGTKMQLTTGEVLPVPKDFCLHPQTGRLLPVSGNVAFDPISNKLVFAVDSIMGEANRNNEAVIPYVPYPLNNTTKQPIKTKLRAMEDRKDLRYNAPMQDIVNGLNVPILAVTIHPQTGAVLPVGGTQTDPVTGLPIAIELGAMMIDPETKTAVPIIGVDIDPSAGRVVPMGGVLASEEGRIQPMLQGLAISDPLSGLKARVGGAVLNDGSATPAMGCEQARLDSITLACEARVLDCVKQYHAKVTSTESAQAGKGLNIRAEKTALEAALSELLKARNNMKRSLLLSRHDIYRREDRAAILASSGGSPGMYAHKKTCQLLPILIGTSMEDPAGSGMEVPILGVEKDRSSGKYRPLGGTMEDPEGQGLVAIQLGRKAVDSITGELSTISGVKLDSKSGCVTPVTLSSDSFKKRKPPLGAVALLEEEIVARRTFWRRQRAKEQEVTLQEFIVALKIIFDPDNVNKKRVDNQLEEFLEHGSDLTASGKREWKRRTAAEQELASVLPPEVLAILTEGDESEVKTEEDHVQNHRRFVEIIRKYFEKMRAAEKRYKDKLAELEGAMNQEAENTQHERYSLEKRRLQGELREHILTKLENLDVVHERLEYIRQRGELLSIEARDVLSGDLMIAGDFSWLAGVYGDAGVATSQGDGQGDITGLLQKLITMLETGAPFVLAPVTNITQGGDTNIFESNNYHQGGAGVMTGAPVVQAAGRAAQTHAGPQPYTVTQTTLVQRDGQGGGAMVIGGGTNLMVDSSKLQLNPGASDDERAEQKRLMLTKQTFDISKLEGDIHGEESRGITEILEDFERRKRGLAADVGRDMRGKLAKAMTDSDREKIMMEYAATLQKYTDALEKQKQSQLDDLKKTLLDRRRQRKKDLHRAQLEEAKSAGFPPDVVPSINIQPHAEMERELWQLTLDLERSLAEQQKVGEDNEDGAAMYDPAMEEKVLSLNLPEEHARQLIETMKTRVANSKHRAEKLKDKLQKRKDRSAKRPEGSGITDMTKDDQKTASSVHNMMTDTDRTREDASLLAALRAMEEEEARRAQMELLRDALKGLPSDERRRIMQEHEDDIFKIQSKLNDDRKSQSDALKAKLAARRRMKEEMDKEEVVNTEIKRIADEQAERGNDDASRLVQQLAVDLNNAATEQQRALLEQQMEAQVALELQQRLAEREGEKDLDYELYKDLRSMEDLVDGEKKLALDAARDKFDRDMMLQKDHMSDADFDRLMKEHKRQLQEMENNYNNEKERQRKAIDKKLADRRKIRNQHLHQQHEVQMGSTLSAQQRERDEATGQAARDREQNILQQLKDHSPDDVENIMYQLLRQRHIRETVHLEGQLEKERATRLAAARAEIVDKRAGGRDVLLAAFDQEMSDLLANSSGLDQAELAQKKDALKKKHKQQLSDYDVMTKQLIEQADKDLRPLLEAEEAGARMDLKERHLAELAELLKKHSNKDRIIQQYEEDAQQARAQAQKHQSDVVQKMHDEYEEKRRKLRQREEEERQRLEAELQRLQSELEADRQREEEMERLRQEERLKARQQQLEERKQKELDDINNKDVSNYERQRLLKEHEENMARLEGTLQKEAARSSDALQAKLEARRNKREASESARINKDHLLQTEAATRDDLLHNMNLEAKGLAPGLASKPGAPGGKPVQPTGLLGATGQSEQDYVNMLMASPLFQQINDLYEMVDQNNGSAAAQMVLGGDYSRPYIDVKDAQWLCEGRLTPVDINNISPSQFVIYRFGVFIIKMLHQHINTPEVTLLLASNLPPNSYEKNCFRHSFHYEHAKKVLFVRHERLESIGDFLMVVLHCVAHIKTGDLKDDSNPVFLREFYKALKFVCQDLFFSRSRTTRMTQGILGSAVAREGLESAFQVTRTVQERDHLTGELFDSKVNGPLEREYSEQAIAGRVHGYEHYRAGARMRQLLSSRGGVKVSAEPAANRLAELKGAAPPHKLARKRPADPDRPKPIKLTGTKPLLQSQLVDLQSRNDALNLELVQLLQNDAMLREELRTADANRSEAIKEQIQNLSIRKENLVKMISLMEADIKTKEKEASKAK